MASEVTSRDDQVMDMVDKAIGVAKTVADPKFIIIPLRMEDSVRIDGLRDAVPVDFKRGWGEGLEKLVDTLRRQGVPHNKGSISVAPQWDAFRKRKAVPLLPEPEQLVSNWLYVAEMPDKIHYYEATGAVREDALKRQVSRLTYPAQKHGRGVFTFADPQDVHDRFQGVASLQLQASMPVDEFVESGMPEAQMAKREASNLVTQFMRDAWERFCKNNGMISYEYAGAKGFHISSDQAPNGHKVHWGRQGGGRRSSMLRNVAKNHVWKYGVTALPRPWPFWHVRLKTRVLFSEDNGTAEGKEITDSKKCIAFEDQDAKGGGTNSGIGVCLLAFLELLSDRSAFIRVPLAPWRDMLLSSEPILFTSPVSTRLPDAADAGSEELDESTLGRPEIELEEP